MADTATNLMQTDLFLALGTTAKARFAARFSTRSGLHSNISFCNRRREKGEIKSPPSFYGFFLLYR
jgi:hypothetical protein